MRFHWILSLSLLFIVPAFAGDISSVQELFQVKLDLEPNRFLPLPAKEITAQVPVKLLTGKNNRIIGLVVEGSDFNYLQKDGSVYRMHMISSAASMEVLRSRSFELSAVVPVRGKISLFQVDGTKLDPETGGPLIVKYASNVLGGMNQVRLHLARRGNTWVAAKSEKGAATGPYVRTITVEMGLLGLGFTAPDYAMLDPNAIVKALGRTEVTNPAVATNMMKAGERTITDFEARPEVIGPVQIMLSSQKAG
ncbi:MAG: hypothetical protein NDJ89_03710 [Oligoflexia bacterium]|nr:hypothetical protein [Oligoflexia bacterium]